MTRTFALSLALAVAAGCGHEAGPHEPSGPIGGAISLALERAGLATVSARGVELEHQLFQPASATTERDVDAQTCGAILIALQEMCESLTAVADAPYQYCAPQATFFYANRIPRCAVRLSVWETVDDRIPETWAFDFSGEPYDGPAPECGNGTLEPGEQCDDGNRELWDGCDSNCELEQFNGCEGVIEYHYQLQQIAFVDQELWDGPRSHLMVNTHAVPLREVTAQTCNAALATGIDVCNELTQTMPFVGWCGAEVELVEDADGPACAVQLQVWFQQIDAESGVYTLELPGVLAFTVR